MFGVGSGGKRVARAERFEMTHGLGDALFGNGIHDSLHSGVGARSGLRNGDNGNQEQCGEKTVRTDRGYSTPATRLIYA
jgi:hypothetical protein